MYKRPGITRDVTPKLPHAYPFYSIYNYLYVLVPPGRYPDWQKHKTIRLFKRLVFPAKRRLTEYHKKLRRAGCPIIWMYWKPAMLNYRILSVGPVEALAEDLSGHPLYLTASIEFEMPRGKPYAPTEDQWKILLQSTRV